MLCFTSDMLVQYFLQQIMLDDVRKATDVCLSLCAEHELLRSDSRRRRWHIDWVFLTINHLPSHETTWKTSHFHWLLYCSNNITEFLHHNFRFSVKIPNGKTSLRNDISLTDKITDGSFLLLGIFLSLVNILLQT